MSTGHRVLVVAHGNALRTLITVLDRLTEDEVEDLTIPTRGIAALRLHPRTVVSRRSGETPDTFIADLVVGTGGGRIQSGGQETRPVTAPLPTVL